MTRVEELTLEMIDGALTGSERAELERLTAASPEALRTHLALLELEHALLAEVGAVDASAAVLRQLAEREARVEVGVSVAIGARPRPARRVVWAMTGVVAAVALLVVLRGGREPPAGGEGTMPSYATVTRAARAEVRVAGSRRTLTAGETLPPGAAIEVADTGALVLRLDDGAVLELGARGVLTLDGDLRAGPARATFRRLRIDRGRIAVQVPNQPDGRRVVFLSPHARATVLGTRFVLDVSAAGTRLAVQEGLVLFEGLRQGDARQVVAGGSAFAAAASSEAGSAAVDQRQAAVIALAPAPLYSWDFDDGARPPGFTHGELAAGPGSARPSNPFCMMGTVNPHGAMTYTVGFDRPGTHILDFSETAVIEFDYWVGPEARRLSLQLESRRFGKNYGLRLDDLVRERWAHAAFRLSDFRPYDTSLPRFEAGDPLDALLIMGGRTGGGPLYIDNLVIREVSREALPPASTANAGPPAPR